MKPAAPSKPKRKPKPKTPRPPLAVGTMLIGLDVSSKAAGIALMEKTATGPRLHRFDLIKPPAAWERFKRIDFISAAVAKFAAETPADLAVIEFTDGARWMATKRAASWATFVVSLAAAQAAARERIRHHVEAVELVTSTEWTKRVPKEDRAEALRRRFWRYATAKDPGLDIADAIGLCDWRMSK